MRGENFRPNSRVGDPPAGRRRREATLSLHVSFLCLVAQWIEKSRFAFGAEQVVTISSNHFFIVAAHRQHIVLFDFENVIIIQSFGPRL